jgi:hypothetical protein
MYVTKVAGAFKLSRPEEMLACCKQLLDILLQRKNNPPGSAIQRNETKKKTK